LSKTHRVVDLHGKRFSASSRMLFMVDVSTMNLTCVYWGLTWTRFSTSRHCQDKDVLQIFSRLLSLQMQGTLLHWYSRFLNKIRLLSLACQLTLIDLCRDSFQARCLVNWSLLQPWVPKNSASTKKSGLNHLGHWSSCGKTYSNQNSTSRCRFPRLVWGQMTQSKYSCIWRCNVLWTSFLMWTRALLRSKEYCKVRKCWLLKLKLRPLNWCPMQCLPLGKSNGKVLMNPPAGCELSTGKVSPFVNGCREFRQKHYSRKE